MREDKQVHACHTRVLEASIDRAGIGTGIDHHRTAGVPAQHHRVALAHIACQREPVRRRPPGPLRQAQGKHRDGRKGHGSEHDSGRATGPLMTPAMAANDMDEPDGHQAGQHRAGQTAGPRECRGRPCGGPFGDEGDPRGEGLSAARKDAGERWREGARDCRTQTEHGDRSDGRCRQEVGRDGHETESIAESRDERQCRHLSSDGQCERGHYSAA